MISEEMKNEIDKAYKSLRDDVANLKKIVHDLSHKIDFLLRKESKSAYMAVLDSVGSFQKISDHYNTLIKIRNRSEDQGLNNLINSLTKRLLECWQNPKCDIKASLEGSTMVEVRSLIAYCEKNAKSFTKEI